MEKVKNDMLMKKYRLKLNKIFKKKEYIFIKMEGVDYTGTLMSQWLLES